MTRRMTSIKNTDEVTAVEGLSNIQIEKSNDETLFRGYETSPDGYPGVVFLEIKVRPDSSWAMNEINAAVEKVFSRNSVLPYTAFSENLHLTLWEEVLDLETYKDFFKWARDAKVLSLKAVEYVSSKGKGLSGTSVPVQCVNFHINAYQLRNGLEILKEGNTLSQGEVLHLPSIRFEGVWESLFFDKDIRSNLIKLMSNMLKFSRAMSKSCRRARMNRLMLLSGPPGTGKTTLSQALAQKLSIRLNKEYRETILIQINAATLLSKFFSESAKHIIQIFTAIEEMCQQKPEYLICVLIDEIESLASSRRTASYRGEVQDGIRATNALLTGLDRVISQPNLIILCTSNMVDVLDTAFLDRCGHQIIVEPPSIEARYQILRESIKDLIAGEIISGDQSVPSYRDAQMALLTEPKEPGSMLIKLCQLLHISVLKNHLYSGKCSARYLGQLPEVALADKLVADQCSLGEALEYMTNFVKEQNALQQIQKRDEQGKLGSAVKRRWED